MTTPRASRPVLLLLFAIAAVFLPQATVSGTPVPVPASARAVAATHGSASAPAPRGGVEHHRSSTPVLGAVPTAGTGSVPSTAARNEHVSAPTLLLVQRPRPPTQRAASATVHAPTGRSPPSPAGT